MDDRYAAPTLLLCYTYLQVQARKSMEAVDFVEADGAGANIGPPGSCRPQLDPILAPWTMLSGKIHYLITNKLYWSIRDNGHII